MKSPKVFLKEVSQEMKAVSWPSKKEVFRLTGMVIGISLVVAVFIGILDFIFTNLATLAFK